MADKRKILIIMMDGFDPAYLQASNMPNAKQMIANGFYKTVSAVMPTVTNVNNTGICCGCSPMDHGITANSYFDLATKKEEYMDKADMVIAPTIFERAAKAGITESALMTAKRKTQSLLRSGATIRVAAERPDEAEGSDIDWVARLGPAPDIYSPEINHWLFRATQIVLNETDCALTYFHTTDYPMHMEPPSGDMSQFHLHEFDTLLGETLNEDPDLEIYMSADHGMNFKKVCYDLNTVLPAKGCDIFFAMSAERDPYVKHHRTFGGTAFVFPQLCQRLRARGRHLPPPRRRRSGLRPLHRGIQISSPPRPHRRHGRDRRHRYRVRPPGQRLRGRGVAGRVSYSRWQRRRERASNRLQPRSGFRRLARIPVQLRSDQADRFLEH